MLFVFFCKKYLGGACIVWPWNTAWLFPCCWVYSLKGGRQREAVIHNDTRMADTLSMHYDIWRLVITSAKFHDDTWFGSIQWFKVENSERKLSSDSFLIYALRNLLWLFCRISVDYTYPLETLKDKAGWWRSKYLLIYTYLFTHNQYFFYAQGQSTGVYLGRAEWRADVSSNWHRLLWAKWTMGFICQM